MTLQPQSITDPIRGLVYFAEDWVDVAHGPFDRFLITIEEPESVVVHPTSQDLPTGFSEEPVPDLIGEWVDNGTVPVTEMIQHLGKSEKIWIILPQAVHARTQSGILPKGVGRIYDHRGIP